MSDKDKLLKKIKQLTLDFEMLKDGRWIPDDNSIDASIDNLEDMRIIIESN